MQYTNTHDLPAPLVSAIKFSDYDKVGHISVSGLIAPPRKRVLERRHDAEITEDVAEGIWRLIGSIGHKILERADTDNHLAEQRITTELHGWTISGKADLLGPDMTLSDYKFTSVYAFLLDDKAEWEQQINLYAWLYRHNGFEAKRGRIVAVLRDWSKPRAARETDYPQVGVIVKEIPLWSPEEQESFAGLRVRAHQQAEKLTDDELPECTDEETWKKPDIWAVKKKGNKRAMPGGLHSTETSAQAFAMIQGPHVEIEHRPGSYPRCELYCSAAPFCKYGKPRMKTVPETEEAA